MDRVFNADMLRLARDAREFTQAELAEKSGVTQVELAERLGQTQSFVSKVERGDRRLDIVQLRSILLEFSVSLPQFVAQLEAELSRHD